MLLCVIVIFRLLLSHSVWYLPCVVPQHVVVDIGLTGLYPPCPALDCQVRRGLYFVFSALLCHRVLGRTMLYPTRLLVSMHCCCLGHIVVPCQVAGFHALLQWAHSHAVPGCWVPCMASVFRLLYSARLLSSMHCCSLYIAILLQVAGFHV